MPRIQPRQDSLARRSTVVALCKCCHASAFSKTITPGLLVYCLGPLGGLFSSLPTSAKMNNLQQPTAKDWAALRTAVAYPAKRFLVATVVTRRLAPDLLKADPSQPGCIRVDATALFEQAKFAAGLEQALLSQLSTIAFVDIFDMNIGQRGSKRVSLILLRPSSRYYPLPASLVLSRLSGAHNLLFFANLAMFSYVCPLTNQEAANIQLNPSKGLVQEDYNIARVLSCVRVDGNINPVRANGDIERYLAGHFPSSTLLNTDVWEFKYSLTQHDTDLFVEQQEPLHPNHIVRFSSPPTPLHELFLVLFGEIHAKFLHLNLGLSLHVHQVPACVERESYWHSARECGYISEDGHLGFQLKSFKLAKSNQAMLPVLPFIDQAVTFHFPEGTELTHNEFKFLRRFLSGDELTTKWLVQLDVSRQSVPTAPDNHEDSDDDSEAASFHENPRYVPDEFEVWYVRSLQKQDKGLVQNEGIIAPGVTASGSNHYHRHNLLGVSELAGVQ
ncbi:hypothetical protein T439DRAFT_347648 [Meredithblackwellia eburnea MCA 4105]